MIDYLTFIEELKKIRETIENNTFDDFYEKYMAII